MRSLLDRIPVINKIRGKKSKMSSSFGSSEEADNMVINLGNEVRSAEKKDVNILIDGIPNPRTINTPSELIFFTDRFEKSCDNILKIKSSEDKSRFADILYERLQKAIYLGKYWEKENAKELTKLRYWKELSLKYKVSKMDESGVVKEPTFQ